VQTLLVKMKIFSKEKGVDKPPYKLKNMAYILFILML
jgi:hypothetical protein